MTLYVILKTQALYYCPGRVRPPWAKLRKFFFGRNSKNRRYREKAAPESAVDIHPGLQYRCQNPQPLSAAITVNASFRISSAAISGFSFSFKSIKNQGTIRNHPAQNQNTFSPSCFVFCDFFQAICLSMFAISAFSAEQLLFSSPG